MVDAAAKIISVLTDTMGLKHRTLGTRVLGTRSPFASDVLYLVACKSLIVIAKGLEKLINVFRFHTDINEETGQSESTDVA